jgi:hypothetical protein
MQGVRVTQRAEKNLTFLRRKKRCDGSLSPRNLLHAPEAPRAKTSRVSPGNVRASESFSTRRAEGGAELGGRARQSTQGAPA